MKNSLTHLDCEQSVFFFRFSESNARASVTRVAICMSRVLLDGLQKTERLLVVYDTSSSTLKLCT